MSGMAPCAGLLDGVGLNHRDMQVKDLKLMVTEDDADVKATLGLHTENSLELADNGGNAAVGKRFDSTDHARA